MTSLKSSIQAARSAGRLPSFQAGSLTSLAKALGLWAPVSLTDVVKALAEAPLPAHVFKRGTSTPIYKDPSGRYYVMDPTPEKGPDAQHQSFYFALRLFDGETASLLNRTRTAPRQILPPVPPSTFWTDPASPGTFFRVLTRDPFPALHYGQLISHQGLYYILEFGGARRVTDAATLAAKGYTDSEAIPVSDFYFNFIALGSTYLPVPPPFPILVQGDARAGVYLYPSPDPPTKNGPAKALLVGQETLFVYAQTYGPPLVVAQAELDAVPFDTKAPKIEKHYKKTITIKKLLCATMWHDGDPSKGGDDLLLLALVDKPSYVGLNDVAQYNIVGKGQPNIWANGTLVRLQDASDTDSDSVHSITFTTNHFFPFTQVVSIVLYVNDGPGYLRSASSNVWLDTKLVGAGDQDVVFTAQGGQNGTAEYRVTVQVEFYKENGQFVPIDPSTYPDNIYKITHFFVLMMENRSFDHLLGANTTLPKELERGGLALPPPIDAGKTQRPPGGYTGPYKPAQDSVAPDLGHEIDDVLGQLVGPDLVRQDQWGKGGTNLVLDGNGSLKASLPNPLAPDFFRQSYQSKLHPNDPNANESPPDTPYGCMDPSAHQAYAVNQLAEDFVLCARWHSSVPGPTWPNRFFLHAGTSGALSVSPDNLGGHAAVVDYVTGNGFSFPKGNIFQRLAGLGYPWRVYHSGQALVWTLQGMSPMWDAPDQMPLLYPFLKLGLLTVIEAAIGNPGLSVPVKLSFDALLGIVIGFIVDTIGNPILGPFELIEMTSELVYLGSNLAVIFGTADYSGKGGLQRDYSHFRSDLQDPGYQPFYTFIEPDQNNSSGHPPQSEQASEAFIEDVYTALRASPLWESGQCALLVTYDEHGGFYDHVMPPRDPKYDPHDDTSRFFGGSHWPESYHETFDFSLLGVRVPALIISPYTFQGGSNPPPRVRFEVFEHASVIKTLQRRLKDADFLSDRVAQTNDLFLSPSGPSVFGNTLLSDVGKAPTSLDRYKPPPPKPMHQASSQPPAPSAMHPRVNYMIERAGEINYRCSIVNDPGVIKRVVAQVPANSTLEDAASALTAALSKELSNHRAAAKQAIDSGSPQGKAAYLDSASAALEQYRSACQKFAVAYRNEVTTVSPKVRYAAIRAVANKAST